MLKFKLKAYYRLYLYGGVGVYSIGGVRIVAQKAKQSTKNEEEKI